METEKKLKHPHLLYTVYNQNASFDELILLRIMSWYCMVYRYNTAHFRAKRYVCTHISHYVLYVSPRNLYKQVVIVSTI